jgi:3-deoxy-D-manno-octulosonic-acid transferase
VFRKQQVFFRGNEFFSGMLQLFDKIFVQNEESVELLKSIGINAELAADTRFDRVYRILNDKKEFPAIEKFKGASKLLIAGSTWKKDEELLVKLMNEGVLSGYKYIIAPHNINESDLQNMEKSLHPVSRRLSKLTEANADETQVVLVDTIGDLAALYAYASIAYVGGGFNAGVHNVLEAAVYGMPVLFGPGYNKSEEAKTLVAKNAAFSTRDYESLSAVLKQLNSDPAIMTRAAKEAGNYVTDNLGGTEKIYRHLLTIVR